LIRFAIQDVDARDKRGHDESELPIRYQRFRRRADHVAQPPIRRLVVKPARPEHGDPARLGHVVGDDHAGHPPLANDVEHETLDGARRGVIERRGGLVKADVAAHVGQIEAGLALGADPGVTVAPYLRSAVYASLLPRLDMLKSLGLVWIPGVMAGMMVSGASPVYAGIYQFVIVAMILSASGIAGLIMTLLMRAHAFSPAAQLMLRPGGPQPAPGKPATGTAGSG